MTTTLSGATVLVTGANGGLGVEFVEQALEGGAAKVYATARNPRNWEDPRVVALPLDVTSEESVAAAAAAAQDVDVVVNNAGVLRYSDNVLTDDFDDIRSTFETNFFGALHVARAFAPVVAANGGGAFINVHSVLSWVAGYNAYSASKSAFWSATNSMRVELAGQGTHVVGVHLGYTDTPMVSEVTDEKAAPADIVRAAYDGFAAGRYEVLADERSVNVKNALSGPLEDLYPQLAR
ncbi:SDR family oxidoreductase [Actinomadura sp. DC4]|uniref:SDR family oxidoreductase n=1 Tax=Actinomadura sp. DC4 TaxID=3055069 RepID=UPI0025AFC158|nr:SDR family oxidoreductase [Actinomadura sp. DC4]MDN3358288.1 SDR family oxidoreductase [Actinomadura sp. DC4]